MRKKIINILHKNNVQISNQKIINELDSLQILDLVFDLEQNFNIKIRIDDIKFTNFTDLNKIESLINKYS